MLLEFDVGAGALGAGAWGAGAGACDVPPLSGVVATVWKFALEPESRTEVRKLDVVRDFWTLRRSRPEFSFLVMFVTLHQPGGIGHSLQDTTLPFHLTTFP